MTDIELALEYLSKQGAIVSMTPENRELGTRVLSFPNGDQYELTDDEILDLKVQGKLSHEGITEVKGAPEE
jgi:hypothetical protein